MTWQLTLYSLLGFGAAGVSAAVAARAWRNRDERGASPLLSLMVALGGWSFVYALQLGFTSASDQLLWQRVGLAIGGTIPAFWFLFTLEYAGWEEEVDRKEAALLAVEPTVFAALVLTNPYHGLVWEDFVSEAASVTVPTLSLGLGYYVHILYAYLIVGVGLSILVLVLVRSSPVYRKQTALLVLCPLPPLVANVAFTLRIEWGPLPALDPTPFTFVITGVLLSLALFRFDLLERSPIARQQALDEMGDGLVVLDADGRVVDADPIARRVMDARRMVGSEITEILPPGIDAEKTKDALRALDGRTMTATVDDRNLSYDLRWSELGGYQGRSFGHVVALRDVTDREEYEEQLEVAHRVLRHNLRNDMNVVRGSAEEVAEVVPEEKSRSVERIIETADNLVDLSEKIRSITRIERSTRGERVNVNPSDFLEDAVEEFRDENPDAEFECDFEASEPRAAVPGRDHLSVPVRNVIENAVEHNDSDDPWVKVRVTSGDERISIHVEDNGPSIPEIEKEPVEKGTNTPVEHGSGIGLWLTRWGVEAAGGDIRFDTRDPRGNVVTLEYPSADGE